MTLTQTLQLYRNTKPLFHAGRRLSVVLALSLFLLGCSSTPPAASVADNTVEAGQPDVILLTVGGLSCPLCAHNVDRQLLRIPGVRDVQVDLGTGEITVHYDPQTPPTPEQLTRAVRDSGFTLRAIHGPALPETQP